MKELFARASEFGLRHVMEWLPGGRVDGDYWTAPNPLRPDKNLGSFKVNLRTGEWKDWAAGDNFGGRDVVSLFYELNASKFDRIASEKRYRNHRGGAMREAAIEILSQYDPLFTPPEDEPKQFVAKKKTDGYWEGWRCVSRPIDNPPVPKDETKWEFVDEKGRICFWIVREIDQDGKKGDYPKTLWTNGVEYRWRKTMLETPYATARPLYNLKELVTRKNDPFILFEGQKKGGLGRKHLSEHFVSTAWYGGAGNTHLTDFEPLIGRTGYFWPDADDTGRAVVKKLREMGVNIILVFPPPGVKSGWGLDDALEEGWSTERIVEFVKNDSAKLPATLIAETAATNLDAVPSKDRIEKIKSALTYVDKEGKNVFQSDWYYQVIDLDPEIARCKLFDYTTGGPVIAYDNTDILENAVIQRLRYYVPIGLISDQAVKRLMSAVSARNRTHNRVANFVDEMKAKHPTTTNSVLDEFMSCLEFLPEHGKYYVETFHKFFLRMHLHILGTRKTADGTFYGLMENDIVPVLQGDQNLGKTTLCRWLACGREDLYVDLGSGSKAKFGSADTIRQVRGRMIGELGEMKIMRKEEDVETVKSFISKAKYELDVKFVEHSQPLPVTISYLGTANPLEYFTDTTGNRRFFIINLIRIFQAKLAKNKELAERLHAHYARMAEATPYDERFEVCRPSPELDLFMTAQRNRAMVKNIDYTAIMQVVIESFEALSVEEKQKGHFITEPIIQKMVKEKNYSSYVSKSSIRMAMTAMGYYYTEQSIKGVKIHGWKKDEEAPF